MNRIIATAALAIVLCACAGTPSGESADDESARSDNQVCKYERGSSVGTRRRLVCRDADAG